MRFNTMVNSVIMISCGGLLFAMFNLGNSKVIRDGFYIMHESMRMQTDRSTIEVKQAMNALPDSIRNSVEDPYKATEELLNYIESFRVHSIALTQSVTEQEAKIMNLQDMAWGTGLDRLHHELLSETMEYNAFTLKRKIQKWKASMTTSGVPSSELEHWVSLDEMSTKEHGNQSWEEAHFSHATIVSLVTYLDQLAVEVSQRYVQFAYALN